HPIETEHFLPNPGQRRLCLARWLHIRRSRRDCWFFANKCKLCRQTYPLNFSGGTFRDFIQDHYSRRYLEMRQPLRHEILDLLFRCRRLLSQNDRSSQIFSELRIGKWERHCLRNRRMVQQHFIDFARRNFLSTAIDDFFEPSGENDVSVVIDITLVARAEP